LLLFWLVLLSLLWLIITYVIILKVLTTFCVYKLFLWDLCFRHVSVYIFYLLAFCALLLFLFAVLLSLAYIGWRLQVTIVFNYFLLYFNVDSSAFRIYILLLALLFFLLLLFLLWYLRHTFNCLLNNRLILLRFVLI
jgi:hypothetical protein